MVEREGQVEHVVLLGAAQPAEPLALQDLQVTDAGRLGEAWGWARPGKGLSASPDPSVPLLGVPREAAAAARLARSRGKSRQEETQEAWEGRRGRMWLAEPLWGSWTDGLGPEEVLPPSA